MPGSEQLFCVRFLSLLCFDAEARLLSVVCRMLNFLRDSQCSSRHQLYFMENWHLQASQTSMHDNDNGNVNTGYVCLNVRCFCFVILPTVII